MADKQGMTQEEAAQLRADFKTAMLSSAGLALGIIGLFFLIPIASAAGIVFAFFGYRTCRPEYKLGKVTSIIGMVTGTVGVLLLFVTLVFGG